MNLFDENRGVVGGVFDTEGGEGSLIHYTSDLVINSHDLKNIISLSVQLLE